MFSTGCAPVGSLRSWSAPYLRTRQSEGRGRQDDHRDQRRRVPGGGRRARPARRPRSAGERVERARRPSGNRGTLDVRPAARRHARRHHRADVGAEPRSRACPSRSRGRGRRASRPGRPRRRDRPRARLRRRRLPVRDPRLPAVARHAHGQRARRREPADRARAVRVLRPRGARPAARERRAHPGRAQPVARPHRPPPDHVRRSHPARDGCRARGARALRAARCSRASCPGPSAWPRRRAMACRSRATPRPPLVPMRTTGSRSRSSRVAEPWPRGLGLGLSALLGDGPAAAGERLLEIPLDELRPNARQPRAHFDDAELAELVASITRDGVLQPVLARPAQDGRGFELIAGERRWRAARAAGLTAVPAIVRDASDREALALALVENVVRTDLDPIEEARAYARLCDEMGLTQANVAEAVGRSRVSVTNALRLLDLPDEVISMLERARAERRPRPCAPARARPRDATEARGRGRPPVLVGACARDRRPRCRRPSRADADTPPRRHSDVAGRRRRGRSRRRGVRGARPSGAGRDGGRERPARAAHPGCERARGAPRCARGRWYAQSSPGRLAQSVRAPL